MATPVIHVVNCHHRREDWPSPRWHYVGRKAMHRDPCYTASNLANPYKVGRDGARDEILPKYKRWLWQRMQTPDSPQSRELAAVLELALRPGGVCLACWCAPRPCHANTISDAIQWLFAEEAS